MFYFFVNYTILSWSFVLCNNLNRGSTMLYAFYWKFNEVAAATLCGFFWGGEARCILRNSDFIPDKHLHCRYR